MLKYIAEHTEQDAVWCEGRSLAHKAQWNDAKEEILGEYGHSLIYAKMKLGLTCFSFDSIVQLIEK